MIRMLITLVAVATILTPHQIRQLQAAEIDRELLYTQQIFPYYGQIKTERYIRGRHLTQHEKDVLARIAQAEAEVEGLEGKALVICVVLNRVECETEFADDVESVVFEKGQFSPVRPGCRYWTVTPDAECYRAVDMVLSEGWDNSRGALYFEGCRNADNWHSRNLEFLFQHRGHRFYK